MHRPFAGEAGRIVTYAGNNSPGIEHCPALSDTLATTSKSLQTEQVSCTAYQAPRNRAASSLRNEEAPSPRRILNGGRKRLVRAPPGLPFRCH